MRGDQEPMASGHIAALVTSSRLVFTDDWKGLIQDSAWTARHPETVYLGL
jgi:hypothetical protein